MNERTREILKARARELARPAGRPQATGEMLHVVEFRLGHERFAVEQSYVVEVHPLKDLTPLPCTPAFLYGIVNVRGQILPVIDLKKFFDLPQAGITDFHMAIIVRAEGIEMGLLAEAIIGARSIPVDTVQPSPPAPTGIPAKYLGGEINEQMVILDVAEILGDPKITINEEVEV